MANSASACSIKKYAPDTKVDTKVVPNPLYSSDLLNVFFGKQ